MVHQHEPCTKEHREDGHHLRFEDEVIREPDRAVQALESSAAHRIAVRGHRPGERDDVHRQNAEERKTAEHIHGEETLGG